MTDSPFCRIVKSLASPIVWREMVSAEAVVRENKKTLNMAEIHINERPLIQQIFGADPATMAEAAKIIVEQNSPEGIDINMGCPVYKITSNFNGAALMKDSALAEKIVKAVKAVVTVPVSVKMRAGWSNPEECIEFAKIIEAAGADLISIHGRTKIQAYTGLANRDVVRKAKKAVSIPVLYNGDITSADDFFSAIEETKCDGALIGRGALGNPWIFRDIEDKINGRVIQTVSMQERIEIINKHLDLHILHYGLQSIPTFRKHLAWYFKGIPGIKQFKQELMTANDRPALEKIFKQLS
ncbi:MAG: tRNA dihydrouridine synthase DusB [Patescibacteria group bacterium]